MLIFLCAVGFSAYAVLKCELALLFRIMPHNKIPAVITNFVHLVNSGDVNGFLNLFTDDGYVNDWGRKFSGRDAIKTWSDKEFIGAEGYLTIKDAEPDGHSFTYDWKSNYYSGPGRMTFEYAGKYIRSMTISD